MNEPGADSVFQSRRNERGASLFVVVLVLLAMAMLAFTALRHSEQESTSSARSRATTRALYAADAGVQLALSRLTQSPANLNAFDIDLADGANMQSRTRTETSPQDFGQIGLGDTPEGYAVTIGSGATQVNRIYQVNVTASAGGSTAEIEAKLSRIETSAGSY